MRCQYELQNYHDKKYMQLKSSDTSEKSRKFSTPLRAFTSPVLCTDLRSGCTYDLGQDSPVRASHSVIKVNS